MLNISAPEKILKPKFNLNILAFPQGILPHHNHHRCYTRMLNFGKAILGFATITQLKSFATVEMVYIIFGIEETWKEDRLIGM
jgi:hypothetical protein